MTGKGRYVLMKQNDVLSLHIITLHCVALAYLDFPKPAALGNHLKTGYSTLNNFELNLFLQLKLDKTLNLRLFAVVLS